MPENTVYPTFFIVLPKAYFTLCPPFEVYNPTFGLDANNVAFRIYERLGDVIWRYSGLMFPPGVTNYLLAKEVKFQMTDDYIFFWPTTKPENGAEYITNPTVLDRFENTFGLPDSKKNIIRVEDYLEIFKDYRFRLITSQMVRDRLRVNHNLVPEDFPVIPWYMTNCDENIPWGKSAEQPTSTI